MKKTIKLAVVAALALGTTSAFATNGSDMIATGAKATGMAGVGIGMSHGAESALVNPALITSVDGTEVEFGGTLFMPNVKNTTGGSTANSSANKNVIPEVSLASKVTDNFYWGIGMWGTAGMGTDYRTAASQMDMVTNLQLMQFGVPLAYKVGGLSVAVTPLLQYGSLDINYNGSSEVGAGTSQDLEMGYNLGASYTTSGLTVGAVYKSQIDMRYTGQLTAAMAGMTGNNSYTNNTLSTPAEVGAGVSYKFGDSTLALDFKQIQWSKAKGYKDFGWKDQNVFSVGYEYATKDWAARLGYNYAKSPITEQANTLNNAFNLLGFPAIVESHNAIGGSYNFSSKTSLDLAYVYAPQVSNTYAVPAAMGSNTMTTKHSQNAVSAQLDYKF